MIKLLDCTLRDGGYINDWNFGKNNIVSVIDNLKKTNVDIIEVGFLKNEEYVEDRTVFNDINQINQYINPQIDGTSYAAMIEVLNPVPAEKLAKRSDETVDFIRVIVWKDMHDDTGERVDALIKGYEYCKSVVEKGYKLCVQPARVDQYSDEEFVDMINLFAKLSPYAIYIVDSWGTLTAEQIMHYSKLADKVLPKNIAIGYHGHNNMLQAYGAALKFIDYNFVEGRDIIIDASIYGIGRCAGNLNIEIIANHLNSFYNKEYNIQSMIDVYEKCIKDIFISHPWGYSIPYFISAICKCHPNYGYYYGCVKKMSDSDIYRVMKLIEGDDKVLFCEKTADMYINSVLGEDCCGKNR